MSLRARFDAMAEERPRWVRRNRYYYSELIRWLKANIPEDGTVLEIGCGTGDLLAALPNRLRYGIDFSPRMVELARARYPDLHLAVMDAQALGFSAPFDYIVLSDLVGHLVDVQGVLEGLARICHPRTRILINSYNHLWRPLLAMAERCGWKMPEGIHNWINLGDLRIFLQISGFEAVRTRMRLLLPLPLPLLASLCNRWLVHLPGVRLFGLVQCVIARPLTCRLPQQPSISVIVPARNEAGTIDAAVRRLPRMGAFTELIFVEGGSTDGTAEEIARVVEQYGSGELRIRSVTQPGRGKGDAVRAGFALAKGEILAILDADLTVPPEDLARGYRLLVSNRAEFVNGCRLIYPMEEEAMQTLNRVGNKFFSLLFTWLLDQPLRDTLCGTKLLYRRDYLRIERLRRQSGSVDPFGDFDLLFGATMLNLKILDLPVRYRRRSYGSTNIDRWRHGWLLLRMSWKAFRRIKQS
ncbi:MAG: glycosyltransferase [Zetaproteobacteria bacterium]|nr:MAG: glycosyltransferase [Zetaproteobacteria bacterium]